jgi:hypothetical protein
VAGPAVEIHHYETIASLLLSVGITASILLGKKFLYVPNPLVLSQ